MVDLHSHILPNIDDGSSSALETFMMLKEAEKSGVTDIIATPHYILEATEQNKQDVINQIKEINQAAREQGIHVKVHPGEEIYAVPNLTELIAQDKIITLNLSKHILIEFAMHDKPRFMENLIFELCNLGYTPVIAHPERYDYVKDNVNIVSDLQNMGALIQCNYGSLIGKYGHTAQKIVIKLLKRVCISSFFDFFLTAGGFKRSKEGKRYSATAVSKLTADKSKTFVSSSVFMALFKD